MADKEITGLKQQLIVAQKELEQQRKLAAVEKLKIDIIVETRIAEIAMRYQNFKKTPYEQALKEVREAIERFLLGYQRVTYMNNEYVSEIKDSKPHFYGKRKSSKAEYFGWFEAGQRSKYGVLQFNSGEMYEGEFKNDKYNGFGKMTWRSGEIYEGQWKDGQSNGKGKHIWPSGQFYEGEWVNDKKHGLGLLVKIDGSTLHGRFENDEFVESLDSDDDNEASLTKDEKKGEREGKRDENLTKKEEFKNLKEINENIQQEAMQPEYNCSGPGSLALSATNISIPQRFCYSDAQKATIAHSVLQNISESDQQTLKEVKLIDVLTQYCELQSSSIDQATTFLKVSIAQFLRNVQKTTYENKSHTCEFQNSKPNGYGMRKTDRATYFGYFQDGLKDKFGQLLFNDGESYIGEFKNDKRSGKGRAEWPNGMKYEGEYSENKYDGVGKMVLPNGDMYEGEWRECCYHGKGRFVGADGAVLEGVFENHVYVGEGK